MGKNIELLLFDADGTLLDSLSMWDHLGENYLKLKGIPVPENLLANMETMTLQDSSVWFHELGIPETPEQIEREILDMADSSYREGIPLLPGVKDALKDFSERKIPMAVFSTSSVTLLRPAFQRTGILSYFRSIYTPENIGAGKDNPASWKEVCAREHSDPENTWVFEDSEYAIQAALQAGLNVMDVSDGGIRGGMPRFL